jgi:hypothetical protein
MILKNIPTKNINPTILDIGGGGGVVRTGGGLKGRTEEEVAKGRIVASPQNKRRRPLLVRVAVIRRGRPAHFCTRASEQCLGSRNQARSKDRRKGTEGMTSAGNMIHRLAAPHAPPPLLRFTNDNTKNPVPGSRRFTPPDHNDRLRKSTREVSGRRNTTSPPPRNIQFPSSRPSSTGHPWEYARSLDSRSGIQNRLTVKPKC